jgi:putative ABC transport system permease protein
VTLVSLVWRNLLRRPARTALTAAGVALGVGLIVALLSLATGVRHSADELIHVGRADFGLFQADVSDFSRSLLPERLAERVASVPGVAKVAKLKLLAGGGFFVFGLDRGEFVWRRLVLLQGRQPRPGEALAGDRLKRAPVAVDHRRFPVAGVYHSGNEFEDAGAVLPLRTVERLAHRPGEITTVAVSVQPGLRARTVAARVEQRFPGTVAVYEPSQAIKVDTSSRLIVDTGWIISLLALIVGGIGVTNTMAMSVFERIREIGILRAVGWRTWRIGLLIVSEAVALCLLALGVGLALGVLAAQLFSDHTSTSGLVQPDFTAGVFAWGLAFALGVALVGAAYPTWRAVRLTPIAALRREGSFRPRSGPSASPVRWRESGGTGRFPQPTRSDHRPVQQVEDALPATGDRGVVRHEQNGHPALCPQIFDQPQDVFSRRRIERAGRLVGEQKPRLVCERPCEGDALTLSAGERRRVGIRAPLEPDLAQQREPALPPLGAYGAPAEHRDLYVLERRQRRDQVVELEDESDRRGAIFGRIACLEGRAVHGDQAGVRPVERSDQVQERALAATGWTGQRHELTRRQMDGGVGQGADLAALEALADVVDDDVGAAAQRGRTQ